LGYFLVLVLIQVGIRAINLIGRKDHVLQPERTNSSGRIEILQLARNGELIHGIGENGPHRATFGTQKKETPVESRPKRNDHSKIVHGRKNPAEYCVKPVYH